MRRGGRWSCIIFKRGEAKYQGCLVFVASSLFHLDESRGTLIQKTEKIWGPKYCNLVYKFTYKNFILGPLWARPILGEEERGKKVELHNPQEG